MVKPFPVLSEALTPVFSFLRPTCFSRMTCLLGPFSRALLVALWMLGGGAGWSADSACLPDGASPTSQTERNLYPPDSLRDAPTSPTAVVFTQRGDYLRAVARRYDVPLASILTLNPGLSDKTFREGDMIRIPLKPGASAPDCPLYLEVRRGPRGHKRIALTFDSSWLEPGQMENLVAVLKAHNVRASFFLTNVYIKKFPDAPRALSREGYPLYNHTGTHPHCTKIDNAALTEELLAVERIVEKTCTATADNPTSHPLTTRPFWRPPYGESDARILELAASLGFRSIYWTVDALDWTTQPPATPESVFHRICKRPFERADGDPDPLDGAIVLMHASGSATPEALKRVIPYLRERGYELVDLPRLFEP
jgi:peptidoglycan/xylan/chitin deacetylase (PgdA/CDA1 family)